MRTSLPGGNFTWVFLVPQWLVSTAQDMKETQTQPKTLCKVLAKQKVGHFILPPPLPKAYSAGRLQATSREEKSHLAVLILAALCLTGRISWLDL